MNDSKRPVTLSACRSKAKKHDNWEKKIGVTALLMLTSVKKSDIIIEAVFCRGESLKINFQTK